jgi:hypothetical protein
MSDAWLLRAGLSIILVLCAGAFLAGCTQKTADPWINDGQQELLAGQHERDQDTAEHLRDRMRSGQAQR